MGPKPRLFTLPISHYCVSVERMLAFKGIAYDAVPTPYHDRQQLLRESGQDYVPTLIHGQSVVTWQQIPDYLEKLKPNPTLYPAGWKGTALVLEDWGHQVLEERVWRAVVTKVPPVLGSDEERWVFEELQTRARGPWSVLQSRRDEFHRDMVTHLALVDRMLEGRSWVLPEPSVADFGVYGGLSPLLTIGESIPAELHNLSGWVGRIQALGGHSGHPAVPSSSAAPSSSS
jgi:glutathione S-transferase